MINIAICDDNIHICSEIENILLKYQKRLYLFSISYNGIQHLFKLNQN